MKTEENVQHSNISTDITHREVAMGQDISVPSPTLEFILYFYCKRMIDFLGALIGIILSSPIMILVSILIKLDSKGPVIFKQERIGRYSKPFIIYKFRTMIIDTPNVPTDDMKDADTYRTRIGAIIRKLSLDELPQLFNILKGQMSFIGPRPMIREHEYLIRRRHEEGIDILLPGLSGLAQVNGRDGISDEDKLRFDEKYLHSFGLYIDMKIFVMTILKVLKKEDVIL